MLVAAVKAVEIANGDDAALERIGHLVEAGKPDEACHWTTAVGCVR